MSAALMSSRVSRRAQGGIGVAVVASLVLALCFVVPYLPRVPKEELVRTSLWALAFMGAAAGWGSELAQRCWPGERIGLSLRVAWGSSLFAFVGGTCAMVSGLSKAVILMWMVGGAALAVRACITGRDRMAAELYARFRATRLHLPLAGVVAFLAVVVLFRYLGGASDFSSNPYDDDVSYYPFAKQLLERGTLIDPFSFRRMSTLGGQALYHAALLIRVQPLHLNVFDRGMCFALAVGLLASHRVGDRKATLFARVVSVAFIVVLPNTGINSASYYSGLAFFIAFFQTLERLPEDAFLDPRSAVRRLVPLALTGAALCTLRQNYQAVVGIVLVSSYGLAALRVRRTALRSVLVEGVICLVLVGVFVAPWLVLSYRSNDTFLFPLMKGTFRAGVDVQSREMTLLRLLRFFADVWLQPDPIYTLPLFFLVGLFVRERSLRRPMAAQWIGGFVSLLALCAAFTLSDAGNLARYAYGFTTASALLTWQTVATLATARSRGSAFALAAPVAVLVFGLSAPLLHPENRFRTKKMIAAQLRDTDELLRRTVPVQAEPPVAAVYRRVQAAVPAGARVLIMLDEPYLLDYARNEIWNLDMPGLASPAPGIPSFQGPEPVAAYLRGLGIRHVAFVMPDRSAYLYRRDVWLDHLYDSEEIWRIYAPYMVDVMDNLTALAATRKHLHDEADVVVLDLEERR
jgi:hypothetical protein